MLAALLSAGCSVFGEPTVETPAYETLASEGDIELRRYPALVMARAPMGEGSSTAFRTLFDYITGENDGGNEIAMTAPVLMGREIAMTAPVLMDGESMAFIAPRRFSAEDMPRPTDPSVEIVETPERVFAAITFSGFLTDGSVDEEEEALRAWLEASRWRAVGPALRAGYNPPWTLPFLRRNEVLIPVAPKEEDQASGSGVTASQASPAM